jgi:putative chitinase
MSAEFLRHELRSDARVKDDPRWIAYIMATVRHETGNTYKPISEKYGKVCVSCGTLYSNISAKATCKTTGNQHSFFADRELYFKVRYEMNKNLRIDLGNTSPGDGARFAGRGYVQITGRKNYDTFTRLLGIPLTDDPNLALIHEHAYEIMVRGMVLGKFTGKKLGDYFNDQSDDPMNARRIINGLDKALKIVDYYAEELPRVS